MASRLWLHRMLHLRPEPVTLWGKVTIAGSGVATLVTANSASKGVESFARSAEGVYDLTLSDIYSAFLGLHITPLLAGPADLTVRWQLRSQDVAGTKVIVVEFRDSTEGVGNGALLEVPNGTELYFTIHVANSAG
jgi:hypothetical protein